MIEQQAPFIGVKVMHQIDQFRTAKPLLTEQLAHMRPVLLFDMGIVSFVASPATGELHLFAALVEMVPEWIGLP
jgi:hypothetical protein